MMHQILRHTATMVANGAQFLESNQFEEAYNQFATALGILVRAENMCLSGQAPVSTTSTTTGSTPAETVKSRIQDDCLLEQLSAMDRSMKQLPSASRRSSMNHKENDSTSSTTSTAHSFRNDAFFVYDEPLLFEPDETEDANGSSQVNVAFYKAILLYDIAITLHRQSHGVDSWSVYRALHFYELCLECCRTKCATHANCLEIMAAALNNKAHIYYDHSEFSTARSLLDTLLVTMIFTYGRPLELEEKNTQGILFNLYMLRMPTTARCA